MNVKVIALPVLILAAAFAFAQQPSNSTPPSDGPTTEQQVPANPSASQPQQPGQADPAAQQPSPTDANSTTVRGCLGAGANNTYTVTEDKTGTVYTLAGKDFSSLSSHVGQEVEADGQPAAGNATGATSGAATDSSASAGMAFQVTHMRKVGDKCTSAKPSSSLKTSPVLVAAAYAPQTTGSAPGTAGPGANGSTSTSGMSTSPQTTTPGQSTPSTATPATPPPTSPGTVNSTTPGTETSPGTTATPGTAATPGAAGSSNANTTPGTQPPCASGTAANSQTPCSTPNTTPEATPVAPDTTATPGATTPETAPPASTAPEATTPPKK